MTQKMGLVKLVGRELGHVWSMLVPISVKTKPVERIKYNESPVIWSGIEHAIFPNIS
jgi:hypothetical protein